MTDFADMIAEELAGVGPTARPVPAPLEAVALSALLRGSVRHPALADALNRATSIDEVLDLIAVDRVVHAGLASFSPMDLFASNARQLLCRLMESRQAS